MLLLATFWLACLALFLDLVHRASPLPVPDPRGENEPKTPNLSQRAPTVSLARQEKPDLRCEHSTTEPINEDPLRGVCAATAALRILGIWAS